MTIEDFYKRSIAQAQKEFKGMTVKRRSQVWWARIMDRLFKTGRFATTIGKSIAVPDDWDKWSGESRYEIIRHEIKHLHQQKRFGLGLFWLGFLVHGFLYLCILPMVLTMRAYFEKGAYRQSAVAIWIGIDLKQNRGVWTDPEFEYDVFERLILKSFCTRDYVWMFPFPGLMRRWVQKTWLEAKELAGGEIIYGDFYHIS